MICLDSSFIIDYLKGDVSAKKALLRCGKTRMFVSEFAIFEVAEGLIFLMGKKSSKKEFDVFFDFIGSLEVLSLNNFFSLDAAKISAELNLKGVRVDSVDSLIAGSMLSNNIYKILTRNTKHFSRIKGLEVISY